MKKNVMMRLAAILLVCVLASTCGISGTYAKYVTEGGKALETARVAHWGVTIDVSGDTAFSKTYKDQAVPAGAPELTVESSTDDKVVAPGTNGTLFTMNVEGSPEVDTQITITADLELNGWILADSSVYCPIVFTVNGTEYAWDSGLYANIDEFEAVVENAITAQAGTYEANADLSTVLDDTISWKWYFDKDTVGNPLSSYQNDINDTFLGDEAAADRAATISLQMTIRIEQVD